MINEQLITNGIAVIYPKVGCYSIFIIIVVVVLYV